MKCIDVYKNFSWLLSLEIYVHVVYKRGQTEECASQYWALNLFRPGFVRPSGTQGASETSPPPTHVTLNRLRYGHQIC